MFVVLKFFDTLVEGLWEFHRFNWSGLRHCRRFNQCRLGTESYFVGFGKPRLTCDQNYWKPASCPHGKRCGLSRFYGLSRCLSRAAIRGNRTRKKLSQMAKMTSIWSIYFPDLGDDTTAKRSISHGARRRSKKWPKK